MTPPRLPNETPGLIALGDATGVFQADEAEALLEGVLNDLQGGRLGDGHQVQVWANGPDDSPAG